MMRRLVLAGALAVLALASAFAPLSSLAAEPATGPVAPAAAVAAAPAPASVPVSAPVSAPVPAAAPAVSTAPLAGPSAGNLVQTTFALLFVLGLLAVLAWALKRYGPKAAGGNAHVQLVGHLNLGGRERIIVVEVGEQWIVVGASPGRVNALATMPKQATSADGASLHPQQPAAPSFGDWLKQTVENRNAN